MSRLGPHVLIVLLCLLTSGREPLHAQEKPGVMRCSCSGGSCEVREGRRACSCGCVVAAEARTTRTLAAESATPCRGGSAGSYPCKDIDLAAFMPLASMAGTRLADIWGWTDPLTGREYALVGQVSGLAFVDVSTPETPVYLGTLPPHTAD